MLQTLTSYVQLTLTTSARATDLGGIHSIGAPIHVYPLYENAFRAYRGQSIRENNAESARLYAQFSQVASQNPYSWNYGKPADTAESIGTVSKRNRMICFPCKTVSRLEPFLHCIDY